MFLGARRKSRLADRQFVKQTVSTSPAPVYTFIFDKRRCRVQRQVRGDDNRQANGWWCHRVLRGNGYQAIRFRRAARTFPRAACFRTWEQFEVRLTQHDACKTMIGLLELAAFNGFPDALERTAGERQAVRSEGVMREVWAAPGRPHRRQCGDYPGPRTKSVTVSEDLIYLNVLPASETRLSRSDKLPLVSLKIVKLGHRNRHDSRISVGEVRCERIVIFRTVADVRIVMPLSQEELIGHGIALTLRSNGRIVRHAKR